MQAVGNARSAAKKAAAKAPLRAPLHLWLLSAAYWFFITISSITLFPLALTIWLLTLPFDRRKWLLHRFTCGWASLYTWLNPAWNITIVGREHIQPGVAYMMIANHQSLLDVLVLFRLFRHFKWVSKAENFRVPCIGWNMSLNGYIKLRRGEKDSIDNMMIACERTIRQGSSVMMFPEGSRSRDGLLRTFKHGAFTIARNTQTPLLPIVIEGTGDALPKAGWVLRWRGHITVRVLPPIPPEQWPAGTPLDVAKNMREFYRQQLGELDE